MVVLETDNLANLTQEGAASWAGLWTGVRPMDFCVNNNRLFIMSKDRDYKNVFYEVVPESTVDIVEGKERLIESTIRTRNFAFGNANSEKVLHSLMVVPENVEGDFKMDVRYRPSQDANFTYWGTLEHKAPFRNCGIPLGQQLNGYAAHSFKVLTLGSPQEESCNPVTNDLSTQFRKVQLEFFIKAKNWRLASYMIKAQEQATEDFPDCETNPDVAIYKECVKDWRLPEDSLCHK